MRIETRETGKGNWRSLRDSFTRERYQPTGDVRFFVLFCFFRNRSSIVLERYYIKYEQQRSRGRSSRMGNIDDREDREDSLELRLFANRRCHRVFCMKFDPMNENRSRTEVLFNRNVMPTPRWFTIFLVFTLKLKVGAVNFGSYFGQVSHILTSQYETFTFLCWK